MDPILPHKAKPSLVLALLAAIGIAVMGYLTYIHYAVGATSVCDLSAKISCDVVNRSLFSEVFGVPVSVFGALYFLIMFLVAAFRGKRDYLLNAVPFTVFSLAFSLYLSGLEFFVIGAVCLFCELSKALMVAILVSSIMQLRKEGHRVPRMIELYALAAGAALTMSVHLLQNAAAIP